MAETKLLNTRELARILGVAVITVQRLSARGELPGTKVAGRWRFRLEAVEAAIQQQAAQAGDERTPLIEALGAIRSELRAIRADLKKLTGGSR